MSVEWAGPSGHIDKSPEKPRVINGPEIELHSVTNEFTQQKRMGHPLGAGPCRNAGHAKLSKRRGVRKLTDAKLDKDKWPIMGTQVNNGCMSHR